MCFFFQLSELRDKILVVQRISVQPPFSIGTRQGVLVTTNVHSSSAHRVTAYPFNHDLLDHAIPENTFSRVRPEPADDMQIRLRMVKQLPDGTSGVDTISMTVTA